MQHLSNVKLSVLYKSTENIRVVSEIWTSRDVKVDIKDGNPGLFAEGYS